MEESIIPYFHKQSLTLENRHGILFLQTIVANLKNQNGV